MFFLWVLCFISLCDAVTRSNFRSCSDSAFCQRHKKYSPSISPYVADLRNAILSDKSSLTFEIFNVAENFTLTATLYSLIDNTFRLKINERNPLRKRYEVQYALVGDLTLKPFTVLDSNDDEFIGKSGRFKFAIHSKPFSFELYNELELVASINSNHLLKFEPYRFPKKKSVAENSTKQDTSDLPESNTFSCEEYFGSHKDSNPFCNSSVGVDINFYNFEHVYGIPEHADRFCLNSTKDHPYRLYNLDVFEYELHEAMALYGSVPYMLAHNAELTLGVLWLNAAETWIDIFSTKDESMVMSRLKRLANCFKKASETKYVNTRWMSETGIIDIFFMCGPQPSDVFRQYARLTGTTELPPLFSLGLHQSRWNYFSENETLGILNNYEKYRIPLDSIWLDIEHTNGRRYFTWNVDKFPKPLEMTKKISALGRKLVTIVDPHIKVDSSYSIYADAKKEKYFVKNSDKETDFEGWCWPGSSSYLNFFDPAVRKWYSERFNLSNYPGSTLDTYLWNDMNEPSVFNGAEVTIPKDVIHYDDVENREVHNLYGMLQHLCTYQGLVDRSGGKKRAFVLSRAFFAGSQRAGAVWTGDNTASWEHMQISIPMVLSLSVTGLSFSGADVGGFFDHDRIGNTELYVRWHQLGALLPFYRIHSHLESRSKEPWTFDERTLHLVRNAIILRYSFLPYFYLLFYRNEFTGAPPVKPLWAVFPNDKHTFELENCFMIGDDLLVHPVIYPKAKEVHVYFPGLNEIWYDLVTFEEYEGSNTKTINLTKPPFEELEYIPRFQRGGSIIPLKLRIRRSTAAMRNDPYTMLIALDSQEKASGELYSDDGDSYEYRTLKKFVHRRITFTNNIITSVSLHDQSNYDSGEWIERIVIMGFRKEPYSVHILYDNQIHYLYYSYSPKINRLILRKPNVPINKDWKITIFTKG